jgi:hypothetical protein
MIKFNLWLEAKRKKVDTNQGSLFDMVPTEEPPVAPEAPKQQMMRTVLATPQEPVKVLVPPQAVKPRKNLVPVADLLRLSRRSPEKTFMIRSFGRTINVKDLHTMHDNGRIVGYDQRGHRYLVSRNVGDNVLVYPTGK